MKTNTKFFVADWNPSGCNDLIVITNYGSDQESMECLPEILFGVNINCYDTIKLYDGFTLLDVAELDLKAVVGKLAVSPVHTKSGQYKKLMQSINGEN